MSFVTEENITDVAVSRWATCHSPRLAEIMTVLVKHLHAFAREVTLTPDEWEQAIQFLTETGKMCTEKRQEFILLSDVLGLSMLTVMMNARHAEGATPATVTGPFHIDGSPELPLGKDMAAGIAGEPCYVVGTVRDTQGRPIEGAVLDVWQADSDGLYESQVEDQNEPRLRAKFTTGADGHFALRTIVPLGYSIPMDGTVGRLMRHTAISHFRPAHIHFMITAPGFQTVITHLFRKGTEYIDSDVVYGVRRELITEFQRRPAGATPLGDRSGTPYSLIEYDFVLEPDIVETQDRLQAIDA